MILATQFLLAFAGGLAGLCMVDDSRATMGGKGVPCGDYPA